MAKRTSPRVPEKEATGIKIVVNNDKPEFDLADQKDQAILKPDWIGPDGTDWLSPLARQPGTQFKARDRLSGRRWQVIEFAVLGKLKGDVLLAPPAFVRDVTTWFWVDPINFCKDMEFRGVTEVPGDDTDDAMDS